MFLRRLLDRYRLIAAILVLGLAMAVQPRAQQVTARQPDCQTFPETSETVCRPFLAYWKEHGSLAQYGFPISSLLTEGSEIDGKTYTVQYFERAVFELHSENQPPYNVLLSLLGSTFYKQKYGAGAPGQQTNTSSGSMLFPQTGKRLGGPFLQHWKNNGGLMQQGYPISDEFQERSALDGKTYTVQYFERAVFEWHAENKPPDDVRLFQLGTFQLKRKYPGGTVSVLPTPTPDAYANLRQRPLPPPSMSPGSPCPTSRARGNVVPSPNDLYVFGSGPVYLTSSDGWGSPDRAGIAHAIARGGFYTVKGPWLSRAEYAGPILVRGRQLDGDHKVSFEYSPSSQPPEEMLLDEQNDLGSTSASRPGWHFWPSGILFPVQGCYGLQIDGLSFTDVIILQAVARQ